MSAKSDAEREAWIARQLHKAPPPPREALQVLSGVLSRPHQDAKRTA